jgi:hypothetical protein
MSILAINPGTYYHIESLEGPRYARYFDRLARPEELDDLDLSQFRVVLIPCRTPADRIQPHADKLRAYLDQGGTIVATGESDSELWLPNVKFTSQPTNFWWWLTPGADLGVRVVKPGARALHLSHREGLHLSPARLVRGAGGRRSARRQRAPAPDPLCR